MSREPVSHVWYTSYGSNCSRDRFLVYLRGGDLGGAAGDHHGARDATDPLADGPAVLPTNVCFTGHTRRWGGAPAFLEHRPHAHGALGRRYLVTLEQFDILDERLGGVCGVDAVDYLPEWGRPSAEDRDEIVRIMAAMGTENVG